LAKEKGYRMSDLSFTQEEKGELAKFSKKLYSRKYCLHPQAPVACSGNIIKAHSVPKSSGLKLIAKNGNVYSFSYLVTPSIIHQDVYAPKQIGVEDASTFTGFCSYHDNKVFEPIDSHLFEVTPHHIFLVSYRSLCFAMFRQKDIVEKGLYLRKFYKKDQKRLVELEERLYIAQFVLNILEREKKLYDSALLNSDFTDTRYYALKVNSIPNYLCAETILPVFDFHGNEVQDISLANLGREYINLSVLGNGIIVFSWLGENTAATRLINSLKALPDEQKINAITRLAFVFVKNLYIAPSWWDSVALDVRQDLANKQVDMMFLGKAPLNTCLMDNGVNYTSLQIASSMSNL
jgi:hypothetical protein